MDYRISALDERHIGRCEALNGLLAQLSSSARPLSREDWESILREPSTRMFVVTDGNDVPVGMATVCRTLAPTGVKWWIEDVVVDERVRGLGLGRRLVRHLLDYVSLLGDATVMLTSRPSRVAANSLYCAMGFERKETNVYRMKVERNGQV